MKPSEINLENHLSTFGCIELENLAVQLITFLATNKDSGIPKWLNYHPGVNDQEDSWERVFTMEKTGIDPVWFAIMCCSGWIEHTWFPKGGFRVTKEFVQRVESWGEKK